MTENAWPFTQSPPTEKEEGEVEMLISMMPEVHYDTALTVLRRNWGDIQKAAAALLEGDTGMDTTPFNLPKTFGQEPERGTGARTPPPSKPEKETPGGIIDLTAAGDEESLAQALQASLNDSTPTFGPSNRAPDPSWAMVSSNTAVPPPAYDSQDDDMKRALEASLLTTGVAQDNYDELPLEQRVRSGDCPVALRPTQGIKVCSALVVHSLFFVPQIKLRIASYRPLPQGIEATDDDNVIEMSPPTEGNAFVVWSVLETFVYMDLARTTELSIDQAMDAFSAVHWESPSENPGDVAHQFYTKLGWTIEETLQEQSESDPYRRLLHFRYGLSDADPPTGPLDKRWDMSVVKVAVRGTPNANDLLSCLSLELSPIGDTRGRQQVIFEPSDVVAFQLLREGMPSGGLRSERRTFSFPTSVYLDQFLQENSQLASNKRDLQRELYAKVDQLKERRGQLRWHEGRDVLTDLRSSIHYYENIAENTENDPGHENYTKDMAIKLHKVLIEVENELREIDVEIRKQEEAAANVYDGPELQKHRYDLRAVLVHDGFYGRSHIYSYVRQHDKWWKVVDYSVTEVPESAVLSDATGLHLNAGPFFLIYSRALSEEEESVRPEWPENVKDSVKNNNKAFYSSLPPEVAMTIEDPNSPPTSPLDHPMELSEQDTQSQPMDLS